MFLLEESVLLHGLLPRLFPNLPFLCIPHEGKQDLEKSIPRKLRAWREAGVHFCVIRDNDQGDCHELKRKLNALCQRLLRVRTEHHHVAFRPCRTGVIGKSVEQITAFPRSTGVCARRRRARQPTLFERIGMMANSLILCGGTGAHAALVTRWTPGRPPPEGWVFPI